jgi:hypothetical protein
VGGWVPRTMRLSSGCVASQNVRFAETPPGSQPYACPLGSSVGRSPEHFAEYASMRSDAPHDSAALPGHFMASQSAAAVALAAATSAAMPQKHCVPNSTAELVKTSWRRALYS